MPRHRNCHSVMMSGPIGNGKMDHSKSRGQARRPDELMQAMLEEMLANADVNVGLAFSLTTNLRMFSPQQGAHETNDQP